MKKNIRILLGVVIAIVGVILTFLGIFRERKISCVNA